MSRYIDADKLKVDMDCKIDFGGLNNRLMVLGMIDDATTADVKPVVHGKWELTRKETFYTIYQ